MIIDFRETDPLARFDADICIVGSGAAGLTLAAHVAGPRRVLLVEAGDRRPPSDRDDWLTGEASDFAFGGFVHGRTRAFGGTTKLWAGQLIRLDEIDFEKREWVPHSGWPITAGQLAPFYDRAERFLGVDAIEYDGRIWSRFGVRDPGFDHVDITPKFTAYMPQPDFTKAFGLRLVRNNPAVDVLLNAVAVELDLNESGQHVTGLRLRGEDGKEGVVRAPVFVLCGGGIETPRLMLASTSVLADGVGNARGLVGRFFQDHPSATTACFTATKTRALQEQFRKLRRAGVTFWPKLALTEAAQRRGRYLNANSLMLFDYAATSALTRAKGVSEALRNRRFADAMRGGPSVLRHVPELAGRFAHTLATGKAPIFAPSRIMLKVHVEQIPDPNNRVTLSSERDRFGVGRAVLNWRVHADELRTMRGLTEAVGQEFRRLGFGETTMRPWLNQDLEAARKEIEDTYHHAGTTRMATSPAEGVTDPDGLVFGTDNLYISGGSLFPTSGYANPTLTIVALAIRLGDALRARFPWG